MTDTPKPPTTAPSRAEIPPITLDGWYVLHQVFALDRDAGRMADPDAVQGALRELAHHIGQTVESEDEGWSGAYRLTGSPADLLIVHFRRDFDGVAKAGREIHELSAANLLHTQEETLSIVELGLYALTLELTREVDPADAEAWTEAVEARLAEERKKPFVQRRLYPVQPGTMPYVCYYPMDKRRRPGQNWYTLPLEERAALMSGHGTIGRRYAGRISQVISGSVGLADWEWAVTLWAADPIAFKQIITDMRYDHGSAEYAEFGPFWVGKRLQDEDYATLLTTGGDA